jgi:hypothetical protein
MLSVGVSCQKSSDVQEYVLGDWACGSVVKHLLSMCEVLSLLPTTEKKEEKRMC